MEQERRNSPERLNESPRPTFNLEDMEPDQVALLVAAIGAAIDAEFKAQENELNKPPILNAALVELLGSDMQTLPARNPEKAKELFRVLVTHPEHWPRELAARMGPGLMRSQSGDHNERQQTIDAWLRLLEDEDEFVREGAVQSLSDSVDSDWIDEPTARYLDSKLPDGWRRETWQS